MRNTAKQIASIAFALTVLSTVSRAEPTYWQFYIDYAVVQHSLKGGVGNWDEFMKLLELNKNSATAIAKFWTFKAQKECYEYIKELVKLKLTTGLSKEEHEKVKKLIDVMLQYHKYKSREY